MMKKGVILALTGVLAIGTLSTFTYAYSEDLTNETGILKIEEKYNIKISKNNYKDMIKFMKKYGYDDIAKAIEKNDYDAMDEFMNDMTDDEYEDMIRIMKESGYGSMANMMETIGKDNMIEMHNSMGGAVSCHGNSSTGYGMMGGY